MPHKPILQQAVSDTAMDIQEAENGTETSHPETSAASNQAPPTYDDQFPTLGGGPGAPRAATAKPFGEWTNKPRVQSSTITQVMFACKIFASLMLGIFVLIEKQYSIMTLLGDKCTVENN